MGTDVAPDDDRHPMDGAVFELVVEAVQAVGGTDVARITQTWGEAAGMYFTEAAPANARRLPS